MKKTETFVSLSSHFSTVAIIEPAKMEGRSRSKKKEINEINPQSVNH